MICWNRFISYIYRYHNNEKCENTGFAKVQKISGNGRIQIGLKDIIEKRDITYLVYIYRETLAVSGADHDEVIPKLQLLGKLPMRAGRGEGNFTFDWNNVMESGKPMTAWNGLLIRQEGQDESESLGNRDMFCSSWTDNRVDYSKAFEKSIHADEDVHEENAYQKQKDVENVSDLTDESYDAQNMTDMEYHIPNFLDTQREELLRMEEGQQDEELQDVQNMESDKVEAALEIAEEAVAESSSHDNPAEEILATHEKLPLLPAYDRVSGMDAEIFECVKITPNDIGLLDMENWRLGVNSFLTHGFYHYQYLMFGRVVFQEKEKSHSYILGVPGIYSSKEKYLADIFGFDRFVPSQETMVKTGSFGYWIVDIKN